MPFSTRRPAKTGSCLSLNSEKGLTLIEVLVSFVILVSLITVASELFRLSVDGLFRVRSEAVIAQALPNIRSIIADLDLEEKGTGKATWGGVTYEWEGRLIKEDRNQTNFPDPEAAGPPGPGNFLMRLYEIDVSVDVTDGGREYRRQFVFVETQYQAVGGS
jgi:hypothetical protein